MQSASLGTKLSFEQVTYRSIIFIIINNNNNNNNSARKCKIPWEYFVLEKGEIAKLLFFFSGKRT
jgi:hypothetical protein